MKARWMLLLAGLSGLPGIVASAGCSHTRRADDAPVTAEKEEQPEDAAKKRPAEARKKTPPATPRKADAEPESAKDGPPLATGPEGLMTEGSVEKIQDRGPLARARPVEGRHLVRKVGRTDAHSAAGLPARQRVAGHRDARRCHSRKAGLEARGHLSRGQEIAGLATRGATGRLFRLRVGPTTGRWPNRDRRIRTSPRGTTCPRCTPRTDPPCCGCSRRSWPRSGSARGRPPRRSRCRSRTRSGCTPPGSRTRYPRFRNRVPSNLPRGARLQSQQH
jgi:hypothetical protein